MTPEDKQYVDQAVQQAAQAAAQAAASQAASQAAQQVAEQVAQQVSQAVQKMLQTTGGVSEAAVGARTTAQAVGERVEDIGGGENIEANLISESQLGKSNAQSVDLMQKMGSLPAEKMFNFLAFQLSQNALSHYKTLDAKIEQMFDSGYQDYLKVGKLADDRTWNIDEVSDLSAKSGVQSDLVQAIASSVAAKLLAAQKAA